MFLGGRERVHWCIGNKWVNESFVTVQLIIQIFSKYNHTPEFSLRTKSLKLQRKLLEVDV